jgi:hypothetical protein
MHREERDLKFCVPELLEADRSLHATTSVINRWCSLMAEHLDSVHRAIVFNFDETMPHVDSKYKVIATAPKKAFRRKSATIPYITMELCFSSLGHRPPPLVILPNKRPSTEVTFFEQTDMLLKTAYVKSGWMTGDIFYEWSQSFVQWLNNYRTKLPEDIRNQPLVVLTNNCRSHCSLEALQYLAGNNVKVLSFPPHLTNVLQLIDVGCVRAFKEALRKEVDHFMPPLELPRVVEEAPKRRQRIVLSALSALCACPLRVCSNAFAAAGICPFSRFALSTRPMSGSLLSTLRWNSARSDHFCCIPDLP